MRQTRAAEPLTMYELVFPSDLNAHGSMFGGRVVALMDKCAGMCSGRWATMTVVTASIDAIQFGTPIRQGQMVEIVSEVVYVGTSSCVVQVKVFSQNLEDTKKVYCCEGYFTMVGVSSLGEPVELPLLPVQSEEEKRKWETAKTIKKAMLARRNLALFSKLE